MDGRVHWVGSSYGGQLQSTFALAHPTLVAGLESLRRTSRRCPVRVPCLFGVGKNGFSLAGQAQTYRAEDSRAQNPGNLPINVKQPLM
jgi:pimeloyl-ACP methyl ester carboxylesterase